MDQYFGLMLMMSTIELPQVRMYWAKETRVACIAGDVYKLFSLLMSDSIPLTGIVNFPCK